MNCNKQEKVQVFKMNAYKNKIRIQNAITYAIVIGCYILIQIMMAGGHVNSLLKGILVPVIGDCSCKFPTPYYIY